LDDMEIWLQKEQETQFVELLLKETPKSIRWDGWTKKHVYVCACQRSGGRKKYKKKFPQQERNVTNKRCGCTCCLVVKSYPNTEHVLGLYEDKHSHMTGQDNAQFTCLPLETRLRIAEMLCLGITHKQIGHHFNLKAIG
jgi:hypothetical protein